MTLPKLTLPAGFAKDVDQWRNAKKGGAMRQKTGWAMAIALGLSGGLSGCINIDAPEEPIVIELNINIRQEVIYRLAEDANETIEENADIF
ncbi:MAG: YnbE family lipoprotein [Pseudomonadota bacterium]